MYVDVWHDKKRDRIEVVERVSGRRNYTGGRAPYVLYYADDHGTHRDIFDRRFAEFVTHDGRKFADKKIELQGRDFAESDITPVQRFLAQQYLNCTTPQLHVCFFDIEVGFVPERGFARPDDPFAEVTAVSLYRQWDRTLVSLVLCPPTLTPDEARVITDTFPNTTLYTDEKDLLLAFLSAIDDADVLSGWNSEGYDVPYLVNRVARVIDKGATRKFCLWNQYPKPREYVKFKKTFQSYEFIGRVHLDYLLLYQKHNQQQLHSYALNAVGEVEVGETKIAYEGTLDELYRKDFSKFIDYNRQDVMLLAKIDDKLKFIELSNQVAHTNTVPLKATLGSVALIEQAIINKIHAHNLLAPDRRSDIVEEDTDDDDEDEEREDAPVVGAYVAKPKIGLHDEVGAVDIKSLYPSTLRALNMSPETIIGQIRTTETQQHIAARVADLPASKRAEAWDGLFAVLEYDHVMGRDETPLVVDFADGSTVTLSARELHDYIFGPDSGMCITANGTIFSTSRPGIIPELLAEWYSQREETQAEAKRFATLAKGVEIDEDLARQLT